jgi:hypothetical protein
MLSERERRSLLRELLAVADRLLTANTLTPEDVALAETDAQGVRSRMTDGYVCDMRKRFDELAKAVGDFAADQAWKRSFKTAAFRSRCHHAHGARMTPLPGALTTIETRLLSEVASSLIVSTRHRAAGPVVPGALTQPREGGALGRLVVR